MYSQLKSLLTDVRWEVSDDKTIITRYGPDVLGIDTMCVYCDDLIFAIKYRPSYVTTIGDMTQFLYSCQMIYNEYSRRHLSKYIHMYIIFATDSGMGVPVLSATGRNNVIVVSETSTAIIPKKIIEKMDGIFIQYQTQSLPVSMMC